jgi:rod shape-determining protein MreD
VTARRALLGVAVLLGALLLQGTVVNRLPLPGSPPDLLLLAVVAFGLAEGRRSGAVMGFAAGLLADLGADAQLGRTALVLTLAGYAAGLAADDVARSRVVPLVVTALTAAGAVSLYAAAGLLLGDPRITVDAWTRAMLSTVPYCVVLTPLVVPAVGALVRRADLDPLRR